MMPILLRGVGVAEILGISRALAYKWMKEGVLPIVTVRPGPTVRVPREALLAWVEAQTQQPAPQLDAKIAAKPVAVDLCQAVKQ